MDRFLFRTYAVSSEDLEKIRKFKEDRKKKIEDPFRTLNILKDEFGRYKKGQFKLPPPKVPSYSEYVVIGGGIMGSSVAYSLKNRAPDSFEVMVIERDPKYTRASTTLSVGGIRQQYSLEENIKLSMYSAEFLRNVKQHLSVLDDDPPDIQFQPQGYLFLATEAGEEQMLKNHKLQTGLGAKVRTYEAQSIKEKISLDEY
ncbi:FAD-dependent oxidoreductase domain-containing protein 1 [Trichonephila inaurata madagascariensis]|uniref:FAD-dependent oxidoreductase domain-containing protein 1 n=1 Tax=Trichonephila inaurata madagascariensis TaxID=2747483 RepID=A0A8X6X5T3_9ARAC|nr:FAD-dependent oxidoreductase domain-containing protein 1 [Trichonephila inaurata madagascariensis]